VSTDLNGLRERLAEACRVLAARGCVPEITGHVSARIPESGDILIRCRHPNDPGVEYTTAKDIRRVNLDGEGADLIDGYRVPGEFAMHSELYRHRPDVGAIVHAHPRSVLVTSIADIPLQPILGGYDPGALEIALSPVPVYPSAALISSREQGRDIALTMGQSNVCILRAHGVVVAGKTIEEATVRTVKMETLAEVTLQVHATGRKPLLLNEADIEGSMEIWRTRPDTFMQWTYEFYRRALKAR
jgi:ribulose-5-phosphate 4-epimerase/fuculose-1-phosphate aldolase